MRNNIIKYSTSGVCLVGLLMCSCVTTATQSTMTYKPAISATKTPVKRIVKYVPVPVPGQLMKLNDSQYSNVKLKKLHVKNLSSYKHKKLVGVAAINAANKKAARQPNSSEYINSIMTFNYMSGALYQIYCAPLSITDIQFEVGERVISVAAGDTLRWQVSKTYSGFGNDRIEHLLVKPVESDITNSLVVTTNLRTYHLVLHATDGTYMASVAWRYPNSGTGFVKQYRQSLPSHRSAVYGLNLNRLDFDYKVNLITGSQPDWWPTMIFNDGHKTYIQFPPNMQEAPTLFVGSLKDARAINYRVTGNYYIVDSVIQQAQLRSGQEHQVVVQIISDK